jgi:hypothetical protein
MDNVLRFFVSFSSQLVFMHVCIFFNFIAYFFFSQIPMRALCIIERKNGLYVLPMPGPYMRRLETLYKQSCKPKERGRRN